MDLMIKFELSHNLLVNKREKERERERERKREREEGKELSVKSERVDDEVFSIHFNWEEREREEKMNLY